MSSVALAVVDALITGNALNLSRLSLTGILVLKSSSFTIPT